MVNKNDLIVEELGFYEPEESSDDGLIVEELGFYEPSDSSDDNLVVEELGFYEPEKSSNFSLLEKAGLKNTKDVDVDVEDTSSRITKGIIRGATSGVDSLGSFFKSLGDDGEVFGNELLADATSFVGDSLKSVTEPTLEALEVESPGIVDKLAEGLGSTASFFIPGMGVAKGAQALKLAPKLSKLIGMGTAGTLEASVSAGQVYDNLIAKGETESEAGNQALKSFYTSIPANIILDRWMFTGNGSGKVLTQALKGMTQEGAQEGIQQVIQNYYSKDPAFQGVAESVLLGGVIGGGVKGAIAKGQKNIQEAQTEMTEQEATKEEQPPIQPQEQETIEDSVNDNEMSIEQDPKPRGKMVQDVLDLAQDTNTKVKAWGKKYFTKEGNMPVQVYHLNEKRKAEIGASQQKIKFLSRDFDKAKEEFGRDLSDQETLILNDALNGKVDLETTPLVSFKPTIQAMRNEIDVLSQRLIDEGVAQGDLKAKIGANKGVYITRAYEIHNNPDWIGNLQKDTKKWNRLMAWYKKELGKGVFRFIPQNNSSKDFLVGKPKDLNLTTDSEKINKILDNFGNKFDRIKQSLDKKKLDVEKRGKIVGQNESLLDKSRDKDFSKEASMEVKDASQLEYLVKKRENIVSKDPMKPVSEKRRVRLQKRRWDLDDKIEKEIENINNKVDILKQEMLDRDITKSQERLNKSKDKLDQLYSKIEELEILKDDYGQYVYDIVFKDEANFVDKKGTVYKPSPAEVKEALDYLSIKESEIDPMLHNVLQDQRKSFTNFYSSKIGKKSLGIFKKRKVMPKEILELYGEITDPKLNFENTAQNIGLLIANDNFLKDVKKAGEGSFLFSDRNQVIDGVRFNEPLGATDEYSPLAGMYTSKEIAEAMKFDPKNTGPLMELVMKTIGMTKMAKTVLTPQTHMRNLVGGVSFAVSQGHMDVKKILPAINAIRTKLDIGKQSSSDREYLLYLTKLGLVDQSTDIGVIKETGVDKFISNKLKAGFVSDIYQAEDLVWKVYGLENEIARYKKALPELSDQEIDAICAENIKNTYPTYSRTSKAVRALGKSPLVSPFPSFPAELIRTTYGTFSLIKKELSDPRLKHIGEKRLNGFVANLILTGYLASAIGRMLTGLDREEEKALRNFLPEWSQDSPLFITGFDKDKKEYSYIDLGGQFPTAYFIQPLFAFLRGDGILDSLWKATVKLTAPFYSEEMITSRFLEAIAGETEQGRKIYSSEDHDFIKFLKGTLYTVKDLEPGFSTSGRRIAKIAKQEEDYIGYYGNVNSIQRELLAHTTGVRVSKYNIAKSLRAKGVHFKKKVRESKDAGFPRAIATKERAYRRSYKWMHNIIKDAKRLGVEESEIRVSLKGIISSTKINSLISGDYERWIQEHVRNIKAKQN